MFYHDDHLAVDRSYVFERFNEYANGIHANIIKKIKKGYDSLSKTSNEFFYNNTLSEIRVCTTDGTFYELIFKDKTSKKFCKVLLPFSCGEGFDFKFITKEGNLITINDHSISVFILRGVNSPKEISDRNLETSVSYFKDSVIEMLSDNLREELYAPFNSWLISPFKLKGIKVTFIKEDKFIIVINVEKPVGQVTLKEICINYEYLSNKIFIEDSAKTNYSIEAIKNLICKELLNKY